jgi:hypothetical protein
LLALRFQRFMLLDRDVPSNSTFRQGILRHAQEYAKFESRAPVLAKAGRFGIIKPVRPMLVDRFPEQRLRGRPNGSCRSAALPSRRAAFVTIHRVGPPHRINHA